MIDYTYSHYVYLNNSIDAHKEHHNNFILNQEPIFYITSLSNLMDEKFTLLPKLFVDKMKKMDKTPYQSCGSVIKSCKTELIK